MRVRGRQNVAKSEILGCYAAALDTPPGSQITNILDNLGVVTTLNRGPPTLARHRLRRTNRTTWNLLFGTISKRNIMMDAIWIKGHTERTSRPANKLHNKCDKLTGLETDKPDLEPSRFPPNDEDFLIMDEHSNLIECDVNIAAIQREAHVCYEHFKSNSPDSQLTHHTQALANTLGGVHHTDKQLGYLTKDPATHRLLIHTRSNTLPTRTRLHKSITQRNSRMNLALCV